MSQDSQTTMMIERLVAMGALWATSKLLATPRMEAFSRKMDRKGSKVKLKASRKMSRGGANLRRQPLVAAAAGVALVAAVGLFTKAAMDR